MTNIWWYGAAAASAAAASASQPVADRATSVEETINPEVLSIVRSNLQSSVTRPGPSRIGQLPRQLHEYQMSQSNYFTDFAWGRHENSEPVILPDTGAKDGLCGDRWACHAGAWADRRGHKWQVGRLEERRHVSGVGTGTQYADEKVRIPVGLEDTKGKFYLGDYNAAVIRNSNLPALLGMNSLAEHNAVIRCRTGEIWFTDSSGCDIKPKGNHVHLQMKRAASGHWYLPVGRFNEVMTKLGEATTNGHLASTSNTPACGKPSSSSRE